MVLHSVTPFNHIVLLLYWPIYSHINTYLLPVTVPCPVPVSICKSFLLSHFPVHSRRNLLITLQKDSSSLRLFDIQLSNCDSKNNNTGGNINDAVSIYIDDIVIMWKKKKYILCDLLKYLTILLSTLDISCVTQTCYQICIKFDLRVPCNLDLQRLLFIVEKLKILAG